MPYKSKEDRLKRYHERKDIINENRRRKRNEKKEEINLKMRLYYQTHKENILSRNKQYRENNKEKLANQRKEFRKNNPEVVRQRKKADYKRHKDQYHIRHQQYYFSHQEEISGKGKEYRQTEKGKFMISKRNAKRRERNKSLQNTLTLQEWKEILETQHNRCIICDKEFGEHLKPTKDHIIPLSKSNNIGLTKENTQALCQPCNSRKSNKM